MPKNLQIVADLGLNSDVIMPPPPGNSTFSPQNTLEGPACLQILKAVLLCQLWSLLNNSNFPVIHMLKHNCR